MGLSLEEFKNIFVKSAEAVLGKEEFDIDLTETFEDAGLDSLDKMNLLLELEEKLELDLGELDLGQENTLELLYKKIFKIIGD